MLRATMALAVLTIAATVTAQTPVLTPSARDELAGDLRGLLLKNLPNPLYEVFRDWGHQSEGRQIRIGKLTADIGHELKNSGVWQKLRVEAMSPNETLVFDLRDVVSPEPGRLTFQVFAALDTHFEYQRQRWEFGVKLLDAKARAKARVKVTLDCEAVSRVENRGLLPEYVIQLKVTKADLRYDNLKFEHIAGIGGEAAQMIGEFAHAAVNQWRPSIERDLLSRANAAIVKAGDNKEVRLSLTKLFKSTKGGGQ